jgi:hypothetical protein
MALPLWQNLKKHHNTSLIIELWEKLSMVGQLILLAEKQHQNRYFLPTFQYVSFTY